MLELILKQLEETGICHRRFFNTITDEHYPHSIYSFKIGLNNYSLDFEAHNYMQDIVEIIASVDRTDDFLYDFTLLISKTVNFFNELSEKE